MRLDSELVNRNIFSSRQKAKNSIVSGQVKINGQTCLKPSYIVMENDKIEITGNLLPYVGRGGLKLEKIVNKHNLSFKNLTCMDIGASTGGFTDCMLKNNADYVYAVDVGTDQLAEKLRNNIRVCNMEKTDIRKISKDMLEREIDFISVDVSFISLKLILPKACELLNDTGKLVVLVKPQFEAGKNNIGKNGIVKSVSVHEKVIKELTEFSEKLGLEIIDIDYSPITGGKGNIEYLFYIKKGTDKKSFDIHKIVKNAFENLKTGGKA